MRIFIIYIYQETEVEVRVGKLKNGNAPSKDVVTEEMIKGEGDRMVERI